MKKLLFSFFIIILNACADITPSDLIDSRYGATSASNNNPSTQVLPDKMVKEKEEPQEEISPVANELFLLATKISRYQHCVNVTKNDRDKKECLEKLTNAQNELNYFVRNIENQRTAMLSILKQAEKLAITPSARQVLSETRTELQNEKSRFNPLVTHICSLTLGAVIMFFIAKK